MGLNVCDYINYSKLENFQINQNKMSNAIWILFVFNYVQYCCLYGM